MKKTLLILSLLTLCPLLKSDETKITQTTEERDLGAASVDQLFKVEQLLETQKSDPDTAEEPLTATLKVAIIANGSASNPLSDIIISSESDESDDNPLPIHKVGTEGLNSVASVEGKWVNANNSSAGFYIFAKGTRNNLDAEGVVKEQNVLITIKVTDSTNVYLENLEVSVSKE
ncbi:MAG: hypothetical protein R3A80_10365 [Bdellovibrionota bacterium]